MEVSVNKLFEFSYYKLLDQLQCKVTNGTILSLPEIWQVRNLRSYTNIIHPKPQVCTKSYAESLKFGKIDTSDITSGFRSTEIISQ